jgi:LacI family transcriptional regulator
VVVCLAHHERPGLPVVRADDGAIGALAARHFLDDGFERFVFDSLGDRSRAARLRWQAFAATVRQAGFQAVWRRPGAGLDPLSVVEVRRARGPLAVFAGHDAVGRDVVRLLAERGLKVPDDAAVLGVDDDAFQCAFSRPTLSSVAVPYREIGQQAAAALAALLEGRRVLASPVLVPPLGVTKRESTDIVCVDDPRLATVLRLIREHACDPWDGKQIATHAGVSRRWLEKEFRRRYDHSPHHAIRGVRMARARVLLRSSTKPLKQVGALCGYRHVQNFVAVFRQDAGETPAAYRERSIGLVKKWKCGGCGFIHDGDNAPEKCPKCGAPREKFALLDEAAATLVERSRHTNMLHAQAIALARELEHVCKDGVKDNLDAGCVDVFKKSLAHAYEIMKLSMTEMQGHMGKGKWG